ncbi:hypothetical protein ACGFIF_05855 [Kribbella sp. NPDC049174]|uniref:hypothetical protein n=1 Tax=Kribbella sp. NPDC049174 TaxID=3364112 RepID=UPI00370F7DE5
MTDDLSAKLAVLTEARPEPADPAAPIRLRIRRRRRRRRGTAVVVATAAATAAVLATGPVLNNLRSAGNEPGVAGFAPSIPVQTLQTMPKLPSTSTTGDHTTVMQPPWSDEVFSKLPDANAYKPKAYYVSRGTIPTETWAMLAFSQYGCMVSDEGPANSFGRPYVCFNEWKPGQRVSYHLVQGHQKEKGAAKIDHTLVFGAVSADARKVVVKAAGQTYIAHAVGTPATDRLRFFALVLPHKDLRLTSVTPLDATDKLTNTPTGVPTGLPCDSDPDSECGAATPAK